MSNHSDVASGGLPAVHHVYGSQLRNTGSAQNAVAPERNLASFYNLHNRKADLWAGVN